MALNGTAYLATTPSVVQVEALEAYLCSFGSPKPSNTPGMLGREKAMIWAVNFSKVNVTYKLTQLE